MDERPSLQPRILTIDDNPSIHADFKMILGKSPNHNDGYLAAEAAFFGEEQQPSIEPSFRIDSALQGKEGFELVQNSVLEGDRYAVAFVDVRMPPGWDGIQTTAEIWKVDPDIQVVICTAHCDYSLEEMLGVLGRSDRLLILKKPFDNVEALQLANALTAKWRLLQQNRATLNNLNEMVAERTAQLLQSQEHFRLIAENVEDLISIVDLEGRQLYYNPSHEKLFGSSAEAKHTFGFGGANQADLANMLKIGKACLESGRSQIVECQAQHRNGSRLVLEAVLNPLGKTGSGRLVILARDVTERKKLESDRARREVQIRQRQKMESMGRLAAGIAHEINTPAQYIADNVRFCAEAFSSVWTAFGQMGAVSDAVSQGGDLKEPAIRLLQATKEADLDYISAEVPKALAQSLEGLAKITRIVQAMKQFAHQGNERVALVDLAAAIETALTVGQNEWIPLAEVVTEFDGALPRVPCVPGEIHQVLLNLILNAAQAISEVVGDGTGGKGKIHISTRRHGDWAEIRIRDTGIGIREEIREHIFDAFFTTKEVGKGTGQGLAVVHNVIVQRHGGEITFESEVRHGTTFIVRLPINSLRRNEKLESKSDVHQN